MTDAKTEIRSRLSDPATVLEKLGLLESAKHQNGKYTIRCPWHPENTPSCSVRRHPGDGTLSVKCFACGASGDVFGLIGQSYGLSQAVDFPEILSLAAGFANVTLDDSKPIKRERPVFKAPPPPEYPPVDELRALWESSVYVTDDAHALKWCEDRGIDPAKIKDLCRVIPSGADLPDWAVYRDESHEKGRYDWIMSGHRLIFPLYGPDGKAKSFKARCLNDGKLKNVNPKNYSSLSLCFACEVGKDMLIGKRDADTVVFVEGEADFMSAVSRRESDSVAIFGVYSGAWSGDHADKLKTKEIILALDDDKPGDAYAEMIAESVKKPR